MERAVARGVEGRGSLPHAMVLASSAQLAELKAKGLKLTEPPFPIARTYLVVAAWEDTARTLGWPRSRCRSWTWSLRRARASWCWATPTPEFSYSGLLAVLLKARAFTGSDTPTTEGLTKAAASWRSLESGPGGVRFLRLGSTRTTCSRTPRTSRRRSCTRVR